MFMYHNCIFCSAHLGANDALEHFPVGRAVAFDAARGRLWAVCPSCARWNLSPLEEPWTAIEQGERLFRDSSVRAQSENVGVAKLRDGTRLIRVGKAQPGELAVWRYGQGLLHRRRRMLGIAGAAALVGGGGLLIGVGVIGAAIAGVGGYVVSSFVEDLADKRRARSVVHRVPADGTPHGRAVAVRGRHLVGARLVKRGADDFGVLLPALAANAEPLVVQGAPGRRLLSRAMVHVNAHGGRGADRRAGHGGGVPAPRGGAREAAASLRRPEHRAGGPAGAGDGRARGHGAPRAAGRAGRAGGDVAAGGGDRHARRQPSRPPRRPRPEPGLTGGTDGRTEGISALLRRGLGAGRRG
jgi:hypothetical protein